MAGSTPNIREVAKRAGVSVGTVSNVLNRPHLVTPTTRERVRAAIKELNFVRNDYARQLRQGRSRTIGLVVLDIANPFFTDVARGVEDTVNREGLAVIVCNSDESLDKETAHLDLLAEMRVQGVLINPIGEITDRIGMLREHDIPVVLFDRQAATPEECSVAVNDVLGGEQAVGHLVESGHRRIAFLGGPSNLRQISERLEGAERAVKAKDSVELEVIETTAPTVASGRSAGDRIADMSPAERPTAVFCANDLLGLGVLQALTHANIRVPEDVALVGYDDIDFAAAAAVPLSSVRQPRQLLGRTAAEFLHDETSNSAHEHRRVLFEPELIVRDSSAVTR
ncbi:LacI family DNA-binding transcriptional regulator [Phytoactinopolyspora halotolerans]|uniref:LacI family transcriptional regulator n=1 Tax=Phytoactinopolyspora halotolerans TaxID=1981512 RepID=A0A6L9S369_9ACTN|nr:LacI family DNA-binding transcriptional regulator [Phytoactinopolyspora halotolerans]NED98867.1 LacI family transcriptional regulator [Phytoactinopolyspora halotolerans]